MKTMACFTMAIASSFVAHSPVAPGAPENATIDDTTDSTVAIRIIVLFPLALTRRPSTDNGSRSRSLRGCAFGPLIKQVLRSTCMPYSRGSCARNNRPRRSCLTETDNEFTPLHCCPQAQTRIIAIRTDALKGVRWEDRTMSTLGETDTLSHVS